MMEECTRKFADDTKLGGVAGTSDGFVAIQRDLKENWEIADKNPMKFNKERVRE